MPTSSDARSGLAGKATGLFLFVCVLAGCNDGPTASGRRVPDVAGTWQGGYTAGLGTSGPFANDPCDASGPVSANLRQADRAISGTFASSSSFLGQATLDAAFVDGGAEGRFVGTIGTEGNQLAAEGLASDHSVSIRFRFANCSISRIDLTR